MPTAPEAPTEEPMGEGGAQPAAPLARTGVPRVADRPSDAPPDGASAAPSEADFDGETDERVYSTSDTVGIDALLTIRERSSSSEPTAADAAAKLTRVSSQSLSQLLGVTVSAPLQVSADAITAATSAAPESLQYIIIVLVVAGVLGVLLGVWAVRRQRKKDEKRERVAKAAAGAGRRRGETDVQAYASPALRRAFQNNMAAGQRPYADQRDDESDEEA